MFWVLIFLFNFFVSPIQAGSLSDSYQATIHSLDFLRSSKTGMLADRIQWNLFDRGLEQKQITNSSTSPTNIGLDLLWMAESFDEFPQHLLSIEKLLSSLETLPKHPASGFYFGWYNYETKEPTAYNISSVDNLHLAIALWALSEYGPEVTRARALKLFQAMDWNFFVDKSHLQWTIIGNYNYDPELEEWSPDGFRYDYLGSEARSLAALIPIFLNLNPKLFVTSQKIEEREIAPNKTTLLTWDGGLFQLLLPQLLIHESQYSPHLREAFTNAVEYVFDNPHLIGKLRVPRAHSASDFWDFNKKEVGYGSFGAWDFLPFIKHKFWEKEEMQSTIEKVFSPHALFLAMEFDVKRTEKSFQKLALLRSKSTDQWFFNNERGWLDALHVQSFEKGYICPSQTSLNQLMSLWLSKNKKMAP